MSNDIIDISVDFDNLDNNNWSSSKSNSNFGGGIELLMNEKKTSTNGPTSDIDIDDLNNLENELNNLASDTTPLTNNFDSGLFGIKTSYDIDDKPSVRFDEQPSFHMNDSNLGFSTANTMDDAKTWDGYGKFNNIPVNPDTRFPSEPRLSKEEMLREKFKYLRKLESLEKKGVELTKKYSMESNLVEMQGEYEMIMEEKAKQNSVKFQAGMMMSIINGMEFLNSRFDPFDIKLDGWSEQINENINDYDDIFSELYDKYKSRASVSPELKLLFQLGGSAMMVHMSNTLFKSAMPGMDDIMKQNPDLMRQFQQAAVNSMSTSSPGLSGFMNNVMHSERSGPPPPMATQGPSAPAPPSNRGGNNMGNMNIRPDISMARTSYMDDGISVKEANIGIPGYQQPQPNVKSQRRPDMKGPGDINDILSGLRTKTINISEAPQQHYNNGGTTPIQDSSIISLDELKSIQSDANVPKRTRRKKSDKNIVSLDI
uniref:Uncharacterized protein n=1 Tax=viral metagenome TaxID=1070528 RepID=A0A6C0ISR1_9ZZZZ